MAHAATAAPSAFLPSDFGELLIATTSKASAILPNTTMLTTDRNEFRIPLIASEVTPAWYGENADITLSDAGLDEEVVTPRKTATLTRISNELASDSTPAAAEVIGSSAARAIATTIDAAFFGTADGTGTSPKGVLSIADDLTTIAGVTTWANVDPFTDAIFAVEAAGASLTAFIAHPSDAKLLAKLKKQTGSNEPLLAPDAASPTRRALAGIPLYTSPAVPPGEVYGLDATRVFTVLRSDISVELDRSVFFGSDGTAIRAIARVGFGFPHPAAIARITLAPAA